VTITEETEIDVTEEDLGTEIVTTTITTVTTTTTTVTNEDSGDILDGDNDYVTSKYEGDMDQDWGGQGPASLPSGNSCGQLGTDKCAMITGSGNNTSTMGVSGMGTTFINTIDISDLQIDNGGEVRYSIKVDKQDAQDRIYMHVSGYNGTTSVFSGTDVLSESGVASSYQSYTGSFDFSGVLNKIIVEVGGRDINMAVGPMFDDVTVNVFYNVINTIVTQHITTMEEIYYLNIFDPVELDFVEEVFEYNDVSMEDGEISFTPIEPEIEDVTLASVELEIAEIEINLPDPEPEIVEVETEVEMEIEMEMDEPIEESQEESQESEQKQPQTPQKEEDLEETVEEEKSSEPKISKKEKAATKIVKKIDDKSRYDDAAQTKTLIVMQILGNTKTFFDAQSTIVDTNVTEYLNKTIDDQYGMLFNMAQDNTIQEMINAQY
tara:strand:- start:992 stop:2296 length:1305 start_codon:yes stop_codon:yes gene_type:complete